MKIIKVPCKQCGSMVNIPEYEKESNQYCDKFCKSRHTMNQRRLSQKTKTPHKKSSCSSCS